MLLHLIDGACEDAGKAYEIVRRELMAYGHGLADKREIVALNKADALTPGQLAEQTRRLKRAAKAEPLIISAVTRQGVPQALRALRNAIEAAAQVQEVPGARASRRLVGTNALVSTT